MTHPLHLSYACVCVNVSMRGVCVCMCRVYKKLAKNTDSKITIPLDIKQIPDELVLIQKKAES